MRIERTHGQRHMEICRYESPLGRMTMASTDGTALTGLWFDGQKYFPTERLREAHEAELPLFRQTREWLDEYFAGGIPDFTPPLSFGGSSFRTAVWEFLLRIPYGSTVTYGQIAAELAAKRGVLVSARAVGGAVGRNAVSVIVPCHRVLGSGGSLTGYAGGLARKRALLRLEGIPFREK